MVIFLRTSRLLPVQLLFSEALWELCSYLFHSCLFGVHTRYSRIGSVCPHHNFFLSSDHYSCYGWVGIFSRTQIDYFFFSNIHLLLLCAALSHSQHDYVIFSSSSVLLAVGNPFNWRKKKPVA